MSAKDELLDYLDEGESILGGCVGNADKPYTIGPDFRGRGAIEGELLSKTELLDQLRKFPWRSGYGRESCPPMTVWTTYRIIFTSCYDGSTSIESVPRNPTEDSAIMPGGG